VTGRPLPASRYDRPVLAVARDLLGCRLTSRTPDGVVVVRLVEVEAYAGATDPGSHAFRGPTRRNATMFGPGGRVYVYFTYGMHWCVNVVCGPTGTAAAVLLRAGEVVKGEELAWARRASARSARDLARGPARLTRALGIDGGWDGESLSGPRLVLAAGEPVPDDAVATGPRVGVAGAGALTPWRFWDTRSPAVSTYRPAVRRRRSAG
jgi:DNA-3-methyladenine glycosylase